MFFKICELQENVRIQRRRTTDKPTKTDIETRCYEASKSEYYVPYVSDGSNTNNLTSDRSEIFQTNKEVYLTSKRQEESQY